MAATCRSCGVELSVGATTCPVCHAPVAATSPSNLMSALAYLLGPVSGVVLLYLEPYDKDEKVRFHARQSIVFSVAWLALNVVIGVFVAVMPSSLGSLLVFLQNIANLGLAVVWVYLMYQAYNGNQFELPVLSDFAKTLWQ